MQRRRFAIILAAGEGTRMQSDVPKVLCEVLFEPMLRWVERACRAAGIDEIYVVAGEGRAQLEAVCPDCAYVTQPERRGTGDAVRAAAAALAGGGDALVLSGDAPFVEAGALLCAYEQHSADGSAITLMSARLPDPAGYGRVLRGADGAVSAVVEQRDASEAQRRINEVNAGAYWFDAAFLAAALKKLDCNNAKGEYYLTDTVRLAADAGRHVGCYLCEDSDAVRGANDRRALRELNSIARLREIDRCIDGGADIPCDDGVIIGTQVSVGRGAQILPGTILRGKTEIGEGAVIGPNSYITDSVVGAGARILASYLTDSTVGARTSIGPFSQLRPDSHIGDDVKIGDFVEIKNATIGEKTSIAHLTYIGDSDVGRLCNFGCGVVTANYNGRQKFRSVIEDRAFIGCNTNLISPVHIGAGAYTAAGTTISEDVPAGALAVGRARQELREGWADAHIQFKAED